MLNSDYRVTLKRSFIIVSDFFVIRKIVFNELMENKNLYNSNEFESTFEEMKRFTYVFKGMRAIKFFKFYSTEFQSSNGVENTLHKYFAICLSKFSFK